jgi:hypothetical protein
VNLGSTVAGKRRGDWGPSVKRVVVETEKTCSICNGSIAIGEAAMFRHWVYTYSHVACGAPARELPRAPTKPNPCLEDDAPFCGNVDCSACGFSGRVPEE